MTLQGQIDETKSRLAVIGTRTETLRNKADINNSEKRELNQLGSEATQLQSQLNILQTSGTSQEVRARTSAFKTQTTRQQISSKEQQKARTQQLTSIQQQIAEQYQTAGFSQAEAKAIAIESERRGQSISSTEARRFLASQPRQSLASAEQRLQMSIDPRQSVSSLRKLGLTDTEISEVKQTSVKPSKAPAIFRDRQTQVTLERQYKKAGYTRREAVLLAAESVRRKQSLPPQVAASYLRKVGTVTPTQIGTPHTSVYDIGPEVEGAIGDVGGDLSQPIGVVSAAESPEGFFEGLRYDIGQQRSVYSTKAARGQLSSFGRVGYFGVGVSSALLDQFFGAKQLITHPKEIVNIPSSIVKEAQDIGKGIQSTAPEFAFGRIAGFYVGAKGFEFAGKGVVKSVDITRVKGAVEVPIESVVAPEYFAGQRYPAIKTGQTAGQLLKEFTPPKQFGVTSLRGFTASPKPFKAITEAGKGASELMGVYQAPKISPAFLRIASEEKALFTLKPFGTLRPSATIIRPTDFKLVTGVKYSQKNLASLGVTKKFFESKAKKGESYIPFVKTEKEAIVPTGTPLTLIDKRFFFKFEGRRIPIYEFDIGKLTDLTKPIKQPKVYSIKDVSKISSYRVGKRGVFSPSDILKVSRSSYTYKPPKSSYIKPSSSVSRASSSNINSYLSSLVSRRGRRYRRRSYTPSYPYPSYPSYPRPFIPPSSPPPSYPPRYPPSSPKFSLTYRKIFPFGSKRQPRTSSFGNMFNVFIRRRGKFKLVGTFGDVGKAFGRGKELTQYGLGQTFKVRGLTGKTSYKIPKGYYAKLEKGEGLVFIEKPKTKINVRREKQLLALARGRIIPRKVKGGKRKKR